MAQRARMKNDRRNVARKHYAIRIVIRGRMLFTKSSKNPGKQENRARKKANANLNSGKCSHLMSAM
jgi:hypothetical protein